MKEKDVLCNEVAKNYAKRTCRTKISHGERIGEDENYVRTVLASLLAPTRSYQTAYNHNFFPVRNQIV